MVFEVTTPVTPGIPEDQPLGTQDEDKGNTSEPYDDAAKVPGDSEAKLVDESATRGINTDTFGIEWDEDVLCNISEAIVPPHVEEKLKDAPLGNLFDEAGKNLTKVSFLICFEFFVCLLRTRSDTKSLKCWDLRCSMH